MFGSPENVDQCTPKQDYEYFSHLLSYHPKFDIIKNPLFYYRVHAKSMNGQNESKSLTSIVKADALVFQNIKKEAIKMGVQQKVQRHFLRKNISRLRLSVDYKNWRAFFMIIDNLVKVLDYLYLKNYFLAKK